MLWGLYWELVWQTLGGLKGALHKQTSESRDYKVRRHRLSMQSGALKHMQRKLLGKVWFGRRLEAVVRGTVCKVSEPHAVCRGAQV